MSSRSLLNMLQIGDSLFPIGAFALSNGLETLVAEEKLQSIMDLEEYLDSFICLLPYNDLGMMLLACTYAEDPEKIRQLDQMYGALKGAEEVRNGSKKLCSRFLKVWESIASYPSLSAYRQHIRSGQCSGYYPIVVGIYVSDIGADITEAAMVYAYSLCSAIVTNAVKTVPLSQMGGQKVLNQAFAKIEKAVKTVKSVKMEDLGVSGPESDIAAMRHETLYSRLYMS